MPRIFPIVPSLEITTGRVETIAKRYERIDEFVTDLTIATGETIATGLITLPSNVSAAEIKTVRAFCTGYTFTLRLNDSSGQPFYAFQDAKDCLVDNNLEIPITGNIGVYVSTTTGVTQTTTVNVKVGVRYTVMEL